MAKIVMHSNLHKQTIKSQPNMLLTKRLIVILILITIITLLVVIIDSLSTISKTPKSISTTPRSISTTPRRSSTSHWKKTPSITVSKSAKSYHTKITLSIIHKPRLKGKSKDT